MQVAGYLVVRNTVMVPTFTNSIVLLQKKYDKANN